MPTLGAGPARLGPNLSSIIGRSAGAVSGYAYSPALKASGIVWTFDNLNKYVTESATLVPGTTMVFPGISTAQDRVNLIAYFATNTGP